MPHGATEGIPNRHSFLRMESLRRKHRTAESLWSVRETPAESPAKADLQSAGRAAECYDEERRSENFPARNGRGLCRNGWISAHPIDIGRRRKNVFRQERSCLASGTVPLLRSRLRSACGNRKRPRRRRKRRSRLYSRQRSGVRTRILLSAGAVRT